MKKVFLKLSVTFSVLLALAFTQSFAQKVYVPDDAFEQFLIGKGYDNVLDDSVLVSNINSIKSLEIFANNIQSWTPIKQVNGFKKVVRYMVPFCFIFRDGLPLSKIFTPVR